MRVLVVYAHPVRSSFNAAIRARAVEALKAAGHEVDDCDLYAEGFDPVLSEAQRIDYHDPAVNRRFVAGYVERLLRAEALVFVYPTWCMGPPAILKGFFDRIMMPGVAFTLEEGGQPRPNLGNVRRVAAMVTHGRTRLAVALMGDMPRKIVTRYLRWFVRRGARIAYLPYYNLNQPDETRQRRFLDRVAREMARF